MDHGDEYSDGGARPGGVADILAAGTVSNVMGPDCV
jgi:hypothetical protein